MNNKTKGVIAGIAGLTLLAGGTTFALWSDSDTLDGGTITAGNLEVDVVGTPVWRDVSDDRSDTGHLIDNLATWRIVPGDTVQGTFDLAIALEGDNLVADLAVTNPTAANGGTVDSVELIDPSTGLSLGSTVGGTTSVLLQASGAGQASGSDELGILTVNNITLTGTPEVTVRAVVTISFDAVNRDDVQAVVADLSSVAVSLNQTRDAGVGNFVVTTP